MDISFRPMTLSHQQAPHIFLCHLTVDIILLCITADELLSSLVPFTKSGQEWVFSLTWRALGWGTAILF